MKIFLVRHGKDDKNYRGGWSNLSLTKEGIEEVEKLSLILKDKKNKYNIQKIISSDLKRAYQTAEIIAKKINVKVELSKKLREINNGYLAGMSNKEALEKYPGIYFNTLEMDERYPGGESPNEFYQRITRDFFEIIKENKKHESIIIVTHSGVINAIYSYINNLKWSNKTQNIKVPSASIFLLNIEGNKSEFSKII